MASLVLTVIGDDQSGLVDALSGVIADHGGNWDESHMSRLAGKFAGIVLVSVPDNKADALIADLAPLEQQGLLDLTVETATPSAAPATPGRATVFTMELIGQDKPGIIHDISHALAEQGVSFEQLETRTLSAPMSGEKLFEAKALLRAPEGVAMTELQDALEQLANELMVDIDLEPEQKG